MRIESLQIGIKVCHPQHGEGSVKTISERAVEISSGSGLKTVEPQSAGLQPNVQITLKYA